MVKRLFVIIYVVLNFDLAYSQTPIYPYDLNIPYLNELIEGKVDSIRIKNNLRKLMLEKHLVEAAQHHVNFLSRQNRLTHSQPKSKFATPQKRVEKFGGKGFLVNENIGFTLSQNTYEATADSLIKQWVNDEILYKNILNHEASITGVAITWSEQNEIFIAVQLFSPSADNQKLLKRTPVDFQTNVDRLPYKIKPYQYSEEVGKIIDESELATRGRFFGTPHPELIKDLFKHRKDGLVLEVVRSPSVECNSEIYYSAYNRRNKNSSINGRLYKPIYKKDLISKDRYRLTRETFENRKERGIKRQKKVVRKLKSTVKGVKTQYKRMKKRNKNNITLLSLNRKRLENKRKLLTEAKDSLKSLKNEPYKPFFWFYQVPSVDFGSQNEMVELNLLVLKKNRIVYPLYHLNYKYEDDFKDTVSAPTIVFDQSSIVIAPKYKKMSTDIAFERNQTTINSPSFEEFKTKLQNHLIDSISLVAFSSVEGSEKINRRLFEARADELNNSLAPFQSENVMYTKKMSENWTLLNTQISESNKYKAWRNLARDSLRRLVNNHRDESDWKKYLKEQRSARVEVVVHENELDTLAYLKEHYDFKRINELRNVQTYMIEAVLDHRLNAQHVYKLKLRKDLTEHSYLLTKRFLLEYKLGLEDDNFDYQSFTRQFMRKLDLKKSSTELLELYFEILVRHWKGSRPNFEANFDIYDELAARGIYNRSMAIFAIKALDHYTRYYEKPNVKYYPKYSGAEYYVRVLPQDIYNFYIKDRQLFVNKERVGILARYFIKNYQLQLAYDILQDYQGRFGYDAEFRAIQIRTSYRHPAVDKKEFVRSVINEYPSMGTKEWCELFEGDYPVSFQALDEEELRDFYCQVCKAN